MTFFKSVRAASLSPLSPRDQPEPLIFNIACRGGFPCGLHEMAGGASALFLAPRPAIYAWLWKVSREGTPMNGCIQALALIFAFAQIVADELETSTTDIPIINVADRGDEANTLWCPTASIGNKCPEPDLFSYNKCCGPTNKDCCSHLRVWVLVSIVVLPVACLLPFVTMLLYRFCCRPPPSGYTPGVRQNPTVSFQAANSSINVPSQTSQANEPSTL